jgi:hypothetical protein
MKKVICAVAAFAMVAGVATVASAEVNLSGDARARLISFDTGKTTGTSSTTYWDSRVRIKVKATTDGGGYAIGRIRLLDGKWGQGGDYTPSAKGAGNVWSDYAYLGFKAGNVDVAAGKMPTGFSNWYKQDERADRFRVKYSSNGLLLAATYDKKLYDGAIGSSVGIVNDIDGNALVVSGTSVNASATYDNIDVYGLTYTQKFSDAVSAGARIEYVADGTDLDLDGWKGTANVAMHFGGNNIILEQSYKESGLFDANDDQYGGYAEWNATFGSITPTATVGYTANGFMADASFGWLMFGGDEPTAKAGNYYIGQDGDTFFVGLSSKFQTSEALSLQANLVYMGIDDTVDVAGNHSSRFGESPIEISGKATYVVNKGVALVAEGGWILSDGDNNDDALAGLARMNVSF